MATRVCGGCIPAIKEFLGQGEWLPAICDYELRLLAARSGGITFNLRLTRSEGRLSASSIEALVKAHPEGRHYLCGSPGFVKSVEAFLTQTGLARHQRHVELFTPIG